MKPRGFNVRADGVNAVLVVSLAPVSVYTGVPVALEPRRRRTGDYSGGKYRSHVGCVGWRTRYDKVGQAWSCLAHMLFRVWVFVTRVLSHLNFFDTSDVKPYGGTPDYSMIVYNGRCRCKGLRTRGWFAGCIGLQCKSAIAQNCQVNSWYILM